MYEVTFKVDDSKFQDWIFNLHHRFASMVQTVIDVYSIIQAEMNRRALIPLDFGILERSFRYDITRSDDFFVEAHYIFDAVDPDSGFHYAEYQHELDPRGIGTYSYYSRARSGHPVGLHHRHGTRGGAFYLLKGIQGAEPFMWRVIEQDYMSLFNGGIK